MADNDMVKIFLFKTLPGMLRCNLNFVKIVFKKEDLIKLKEVVLNDNKCDKKKGLNTIELLLKNNEERVDDSIIVNDYDKFFEIIRLIFIECEKKGRSGNEFIKNIWLRMGIEDLNNVERFLERQYEFLKNDKFLYCDYFKDDNVSIVGMSNENSELFETNTHMKFVLETKNHERYKFPVVHYGISKKNNNPVCYIYGIQNPHTKNIENEFINEFLRPVKKNLRNKYVSKDFVLALGMFLDMMYEKGIEEIRVPIFQVFNYKYHEYLSTWVNFIYNSYGKREKAKLEKDYKNGIKNDDVLDYIRNKMMYERFSDKEDVISYNKTERFINTFIVLNDVFDNIDICNEPFIQGDELIIKIKKSTNIVDKLSEKSKEYSK